MKPSVRNISVGVVATLSLAGCGGGVFSRPPLTVPARMEIVRGETREYGIRVNQQKEEAAGSTTTLSLLGFPQDVEATLTPTEAAVQVLGTEVALTLVADRAAVAETTQVRIARTRGNTVAEAISELKVRDFGVFIESSPRSISLNRGETEEFRVTLRRRGNSSGSLQLGTLKLPNGVSARYNPSRVEIGPDTETVRVTVRFIAEMDAPVGQSNARIVAFKGVNEDVSSSIDVRVTE